MELAKKLGLKLPASMILKSKDILYPHVQEGIGDAFSANAKALCIDEKPQPLTALTFFKKRLSNHSLFINALKKHKTNLKMHRMLQFSKKFDLEQR